MPNVQPRCFVFQPAATGAATRYNSRMKITFIAFGTRGDVQPTLAVGKALQARGHQVSMIASANFKNWIEGHGLHAWPSQVDVQAVMQSEQGLDWIEHGHDPVRQLQVMQKSLNLNGRAMMEDAWQACQGAEVVVSSFTSDLYAGTIAEQLGAKHVSTPLQPAVLATRSGAATMNAPLPNQTSIFNYWFGRLLVEPMGWRLIGKLTNAFRQETLQLPPLTAEAAQMVLRRAWVVQGISAQVVPPPADWPPNVHTAGYWFLDEDTAWQPPPDLQRFLAAGPPPVYIGFGSMTGRKVQAVTDTVVAAVQQAGLRAVLQAGWAGMGATQLPPEIFLLQSAPHAALFPLMSAVVHHGGAGTTAEGLRAGKPTLIIPHIADQFFWGQRIQALGLGPAPIARAHLNVAKLAAALGSLAQNAHFREQAGALGQRLRAEDGVGNAVRLIERYLSASNPSRSTHV